MKGCQKKSLSVGKKYQFHKLQLQKFDEIKKSIPGWEWI